MQAVVILTILGGLQYDFNLSQRVRTIVNNSAANGHIFLLKHSPFFVYITFR